METNKEEIKDKKNKVKDREENKNDKAKEEGIIEMKMEKEEKGEEQVVIELSEDMKKHIENKIFSLNEKTKFSFQFLYNKIIRRIIIKNILIYYTDNFASIICGNITYVFFYKLIPVEINFIYKEASKNKTEKFSICSTYELFEYSKKKKCKPCLKIDNNNFEFDFIFEIIVFKKLANLDKIILEQDYRKYVDFKKEEPPNIFPKNKTKLEPEKLSKFFNLFFKYETKSTFEYLDSRKRDDLN